MIERPIISRQTDRCISISNRYQRVVRLRFFISHFFSEVFAFCDSTVFYFRPYRYIPIYFLLYFQFRSVDWLGWFWWIGGNFRYILLSAMTRQHAPISYQLTGRELFSRHPRVKRDFFAPMETRLNARNYWWQIPSWVSRRMHRTDLDFSFLLTCPKDDSITLWYEFFRHECFDF